MIGVELAGVQVHHDLPGLAAVGKRDRGPLHGGELGANEIQPVIGELLLGQGVTVQGQLQDRDAGGVVLDHRRREDAGREGPKERLHDRSDLSNRQLRFHIGLKVDLDDGHAVIRLRLDVFDVVHGCGHGPLGDGHNALLHLVGRHARVGLDHADHGDVDVGKDVRRHGEDRNPAQDSDQDRHHHKRVRAAQRQPNNPHDA